MNWLWLKYFKQYKTLINGKANKGVYSWRQIYINGLVLVSYNLLLSKQLSPKGSGLLVLLLPLLAGMSISFSKVARSWKGKRVWNEKKDLVFTCLSQNLAEHGTSRNNSFLEVLLRKFGEIFLCCWMCRTVQLFLGRKICAALAACASGDIGRTVIWQYRKKPPNIGIYTIK